MTEHQYTENTRRLPVSETPACPQYILELALRQIKGLDCTPDEARRAAAEALGCARVGADGPAGAQDPWSRCGCWLRAGIDAVLEIRRRERMEQFLPFLASLARPPVRPDEVPRVLARRLCSKLRLQWHDAEDAAQQTLLLGCRLWAAGIALDHPTAWWPYLMMVGWRKMLTDARKRKMAKKHEAAVAGRRSGGVPDPSTEAEYREYDEWLQRKIAALSPVDRVIVLARLDGMNYQQIGEKLGCSSTTVARKLIRLIPRLGLPQPLT